MYPGQLPRVLKLPKGAADASGGSSGSASCVAVSCRIGGVGIHGAVGALGAVSSYGAVRTDGGIFRSGGRMVVWGGMVVTVVGAVVGRGRGATVVICVVADVSMPLSLRQAVSIAAVRTKVSARIVNRFIMILL